MNLRIPNTALLVAMLLLLGSVSATGQTILGEWKTIDDETGKPRSIVTIVQDGEVASATIKELFREPDEELDPMCDKCKGDLFNARIKGMTIVWDMKQKGDSWSGGKILDPANGKVYRCKMWVKDGKLKVRGYKGPFYRTQTWEPVSLGFSQ